MNRSGAPAYAWLLCLIYVCYILNHIATGSLNWKVPLFCLTGNPIDISVLFLFFFWEEVYYSNPEHGFPSESSEKKGRFVGFGDNVGDAFTFKILMEDTKKIIYRSNVRPASKASTRNKRIDDENKKVDFEFIKSIWEEKNRNKDRDGTTKRLPMFEPSDLIGRTFLKLPEEDGQRFRAKIIKAIAEHRSDIEKHPDRV